MMGGLFNMEELSSRPVIIPVHLNEWVRFDQPGVYKVTVTSRRLSKTTPRLANAGGHPLEAAPVELHIIAATPEWQASTLARILAALKTPPQPINSLEPHKDALADLRFLASPAAIEELAARLRDDRPEDIYTASFGLMGLAPALHDTALTAMNRRLDDPQFPVSAQFLWTMASLHLRGDESSGSFRQSPEEEAYRKAAWQAALSALPRKEGKARADTAQTLLSYNPGGPSPQAEAQIAAILASSFLDLSQDKQARTLQWGWDDIRSPAMLPTLKALAQHPPVAGGASFSIYGTSKLRAAALRRWYELDPAGAEREALAQISSERPTLSAADLSFLPDQQLPQLETQWASALTSTAEDHRHQATLAGLMVRFGTGAATPQVTALLGENVGTLPCVAQSAALAYLVKFDSDASARFLAQAIAARGKHSTGCGRSIFLDVARHAFSPALTHAAIEALHDPDSAVVQNALEYLIAYGDVSARQPILDRYMQWTAAWAGKGQELDDPAAATQETDWADRQLGQTLGRALLANIGWLADAALTNTVLQRCAGKQMCDQLKFFGTRSTNVTISDWPSTTYSIGEARTPDLKLFETRLSQYPKDTVFTLIPTSPRSRDQKAFEAGLQKVFAEHDLKLKTSGE